MHPNEVIIPLVQSIVDFDVKKYEIIPIGYTKERNINKNVKMVNLKINKKLKLQRQRKIWSFYTSH
jgi:hypothetical protein